MSTDRAYQPEQRLDQPPRTAVESANNLGSLSLNDLRATLKAERGRAETTSKLPPFQVAGKTIRFDPCAGRYTQENTAKSCVQG